MSSTRKRNRPEDWGDLEPSPVIHISELPEHTLEIDLLRIFEQYGPIRDLAMMPHRGQALLEYSDLSSAENAVHRCSENQMILANHRIRVNYSTSKRIVQRQSGGEPNRDYPDGPIESLSHNRGCRASNHFPSWTRLTHCDLSENSCSKFKSTDDARNVKRNLNGADIYSGCCTLKVEFARPTRLTVLKNDQETWDFENSLLPTDAGRIRTSDGRANVSLLGRFGRNLERLDNGRPQNGEGHNFDAYSRQSALSVHPSLAGISAPDVTVHGRPATSVIMVYNLDVNQMNCDRLFNLLCLYGNVVRIKYLRTKEGSAMAQLGDTISVDRTIRNLSGAPLLDNKLLIRSSKQLVIVDVPKPFELPDGTPSFKDYTGSRENRYINPEKASKNRIYPPSNTLHYWNCPPNFSSTDLCQVFVDVGAEPPTRVAEFPSASERSSSGLVEWANTADAVAALAFANHYSIPYPKGRFPFILKLSFSNAPVQERLPPGSRPTPRANQVSVSNLHQPMRPNTGEYISAHSIQTQPTAHAF
ncbi:hypothetical protein AHF37_03250 [Paragonimus kellicotti]|nr:hypothetical protein AHF37_03250 [Paragonimus kellicotti]